MPDLETARPLHGQEAMSVWAHRHWLRLRGLELLDAQRGGRWLTTMLKVLLVVLAVLLPGGTLLLLGIAAFSALRSGQPSRLVANLVSVRRDQR